MNYQLKSERVSGLVPSGSSVAIDHQIAPEGLWVIQVAPSVYDGTGAIVEASNLRNQLTVSLFEKGNANAARIFDTLDLFVLSRMQDNPVWRGLQLTPNKIYTFSISHSALVNVMTGTPTVVLDIIGYAGMYLK